MLTNFVHPCVILEEEGQLCMCRISVDIILKLRFGLFGHKFTVGHQDKAHLLDLLLGLLIA